MLYRVRRTILLSAALGVGFLFSYPFTVRGSSTVEPEGRSGSASVVELLDRHGEPAIAWRRADPQTPSGVLARLLTETGRFLEADSVLAAHPPIGGENPNPYYVRRALVNLRAGRTDRARQYAAAVDTTASPDVRAYAALIEAQAALEEGAFGRALAVAGNELRGWPRVIRTEMLSARVAALRGLNRTSEALALLSARVRRDTPRWQLIFFELEWATGERLRARATARNMARRSPGAPETGEAAERVWRDVGPAGLSSAEALDWADYYIGRGDYVRARGCLDASRRGRSRFVRDRRRILLADLAFREGRFSRASALARPRVSDPSLKRLSVLILARAERRLGNRSRSARLYSYFSRTWPNDRKAAEALYVARQLFRRVGDVGAAARVDERLRRGYPSSIQGRRSAVEYAFSLAERGATAQAAAVLRRRVERSRGTDESALFYLSRIYELTGKKRSSQMLLDELHGLDPYSFYLRPHVATGDIAVPARGATGTVAYDGPYGLMQFLERADAERGAAIGRLRAAIGGGAVSGLSSDFASCTERGQWLLACGFREWGARELREAGERCAGSPAGLLELGRIYDAWAMPWKSVRMYQRASDRTHWKKRRELAGDFRVLMYPTPHPVQVFDNAAQSGVPPHVAYAMMREESRFEPEAVSRAGAVGLMQLMPSTARRVARELEITGWAEEDLLDPRVNIAFGIWYAGRLFARGGGSVHWMLAAYNAGPGNAKRWFSDVDDIVDAVDAIDFRETNGYVRRIVESANIYHDLYFSRADTPAR